LLDWQIFDIQNRLRTDPASLLQELESFRERLQNLEGPVPEDYIEDVNRVIQLLTTFSQISVDLTPLQWSNGLWLAARTHCED
jgi:hypothetical protein